MSKLDIIILDCANKVLDGKEEKLGDYVDPTKQDIKDLMQDLTDDHLGRLLEFEIEGEDAEFIKWRSVVLAVDELRKKVEEL